MNTSRCILDLRGLVLHAYYSNVAGLSATVRNAEGKKVPAAEHGVNQFIEIYLKPILERFAPWQIIACLEGSKSNQRRRGILVDYKEKKEQDADDAVVAEQKALCLEGCQRLLLHLGATLVSAPFAEADDVVAHLVERLPGEHTVYTVDKDLMALYRPGLTIMWSDRQIGASVERHDFEGMDLREVSPRMVTLYKSLVGDSSDNIKGVPQFGAAKALPDLIAAVGWDGMEELATIVDHKLWDVLDEAIAGDPTNKPLALIGKHRDAWRTSWRVAQLHPEWCELNFGQKPVSLKWAKRVPLKENVLKELARFNLQDRIDEFVPYCVKRWLIDAPKLERMKAGKSYADMLRSMQSSELVGFDWETWDTLKHQPYQEAGRGKYVDVLNSEPTGGSFCFGPNLNYCFYLPVNHRDTANCPKDELRELLVETEGCTRVAHNSMFESVVAAKTLDYRFPHGNLPHDTAVLSSYADENEDAGLKKLSKVWLNYEQTNYGDVVPKGGDMRDVSGLEVMDYGCDDSIVTAHLFILFRTIAQCEQTWDFYERNERFFYEAHIDSFLKGIPIDYARLEELRQEDEELAIETDAKLRELLAEKCDKINLAGFKVIGSEIAEYTEAAYFAACKKKGEEPDEEIRVAKIEAALDKVKDGCHYSEFAPPEVDLDAKETVKLVSALSRGLGLASIRSLRPAKVRDWCESIYQQANEAEQSLTPKQEDWLQALMQFAEGEPGALEHLVRSRLEQDPSLWTGTELNVGSPLQMAMLFYGMLNLPILIRNEAQEGSARDQFEMPGAPATNELAMLTWLVELPEGDWRREVIELVRTLRACRQRNSLYYKPYPLWQSPIDGRIHPQFRNCGTITRRPSGNSPNALQVSKVKDEGRVRSCYMPQSYDQEGVEEEVVVSIDWAQQEIRIAAAGSGDPTLLACYVGDNRKDVHTATAVAIMNVLNKRARELPWTYEQYELIRKSKTHEKFWHATEVRNKKAKPTNFLMMYGGSPVGLSRKLVVSKELGEEFFTAFFDMYPGLATRQEEIVKFARKHGYSLTMFGNRKHAPHILSKDRAIASGAERQVINMEMQGTAADVCKMTCREWVLQDVPGKTGATLYAFVYDEVVASVPKSKVKLYIDMMMDIMQITLPGTEVVLEAEASLGGSWGKQIELNGDHSEENISKAIEEALA